MSMPYRILWPHHPWLLIPQTHGCTLNRWPPHHRRDSYLAISAHAMLCSETPFPRHHLPPRFIVTWGCFNHVWSRWQCSRTRCKNSPTHGIRKRPGSKRHHTRWSKCFVMLTGRHCLQRSMSQQFARPAAAQRPWMPERVLNYCPPSLTATSTKLAAALSTDDRSLQRRRDSWSISAHAMPSPFHPIDSPDENASIVCKPDGNGGRHSWGAKRKADGG